MQASPPAISTYMAPATLVDLWTSWLSQSGVDMRGWLLAWARVGPTLALVPIFGGAALPAAARAGLGFAMASAIAPALRPVTAALPFEIAVTVEAARGLPVAIGAAVLVHTALMVGGVIDDLRGARGSASIPVFEFEHTPVAALFGLLVALALLKSGAPARLVATLAQPTPGVGVLSIVHTLTASVGIALAVAAPIIGIAVVLSVTEALLARAASPAHVKELLAPMRSVALLAVLALALDRIQGALLLALGL